MVVIIELKVWVILNRKGRQNVPLLNDQANMTPTLNGNLSIHSIRLKLKKDPFPSNLYSHIPSKMDPSHPPPPSGGGGEGDKNREDKRKRAG